ncbi:MAG TPA: LysR family transcriptional regulator [Sphingomonas sp.]|nr:LysR family transcriptional regulator [Sphingomonas sp.]
MTEAFDLNLKHLRALNLIATLGSVSAAANAVGLSQPALTQGIAKLEAQFGAVLFDRRPHGVVPTGAGSKILARVERAMARLSRNIAAASARPRAIMPANNLTSAQLRAFLSFAEAGSFVGAAQTLGLSEPAVHRAVRELERLCNSPLIVRRGRGVGLNETGRALASGFALAVSELNAALQEAARQRGHLAIGAMALSRSRLVPVTLAELTQAFPGAAIDVVEGSHVELIEFLRAGSIDVIIGALREQPPADLAQEILLLDRITVIGRAGHPLANACPGLQDLALYPWIVGRRTSPLLEQWQQLFDEAGVERPRAPIRCGSVTTIRGLLAHSDFLTLLSRDQVSAEIEAGLLVPIRCTVPDTMRTIGAVTRRDWYPTDLQRRFMDLLRTAASARRPQEIE